MRKPVVVTGLISAGVILGLTIASLAPEPRHVQTSEWLDNPRQLAEFRLESARNAFDNTSLNGGWSILSFGFLHCPDVCPTSLAQLARLAEALGSDTDVSFIFISVDPRRDSAEAVNRYAGHFHPSFLGATGQETELRQLAGSLGIQFDVAPDGTDVAHSVTFSLIDPAGRLAGRFRPGFNVNDFITELDVQRLETSS